MKKMSKLIALLLALVMLLSCMTACSKNEEPAVETPPASEPEKAPEAEAPPAEKAPAEESEVTLTIGVMQDVDVIDYETNAYTLWLEEVNGINLEFVYFSNDGTEAAQQLSLMMNAGEELPDILYNFTGINQAASYEYGEAGYFIDLMPLIEEYGVNYKEAKANMNSQSDAAMLESYGIDPNNGALYGMPSYQIAGGSSDLISNHSMINKVWLDKIGEDIPTTVDELVNVLTKFVTEDPNGNGVNDEMGMTGIISRSRGNLLEYVINAYVFSEDMYLYNINDDGEIYFPFATDEYRQAMIKLNEMYSKGLISPISFTMKEDAEIMSIFTPADGVSLTGVAFGHPILIAADQGWNATEYVALPTLKAETELGGYMPWRSATFQWCTYITEDCEDPVAAFKFIDSMYTEEATIRMRWGEKDVDWEYAPEGSVNIYGQEADLVIINDGFSGQNNSTWHELGTMILDYGNFVCIGVNFDPNVSVEEMDWPARKDYWINNDLIPGWYASPKNENQFFNVVYNGDEIGTVAEYQTMFAQYVEEARALFVTGTMDPNSDSDWQTYLDNLEANGMSQLVDVTQSAYTRMRG